MAETRIIPRTYDEAIHTLAEWHHGDDLPDFRAFSFPDPDGQIVRLVEVSDAFPSTGRVAAYPFGRSSEFPFRSMVAQVNDAEWQQILDGSLPLPAGWNIENRQQVWP